MFVYRDAKGRIVDVTGSINNEELERLKAEYGEVDPGEAEGDVTLQSSSEEESSGEESSEETPESNKFFFESQVERPKVADLKEAWVDFAVKQGMERDEAEALTKQELVDEYGE